MASMRAQFDGKVLVPVGPVTLESGHLYEIEVREIDEPVLGSGEVILRFLRTMPKLPPEDIASMERALEVSDLSSREEPLFDEEDVG